jgi:hypothetical protein
MKVVIDPEHRIAELERQLHWAQLKIQVLEEELRQRRIQMLGPRSETLSDCNWSCWPKKNRERRPRKWRLKLGARR